MESKTKDIETLDTCVILRAFTMDMPEQVAKVKKMLKKEGVRYYVSDMAVTEAVHVMEHKKYDYQYSRERIRTVVLGFLGMSNICNGTGIFEGVFQLYLEHPKLSFVDCYLAVQAGLQGTTPLWTFDRKLAGQAEEAKLV
ncbi:PIN domain-containing protein [Candidatus Saccharibacteria bacterium]|nr:PIN domain-containing protein [Candidatus Saccharibacteria bacterium]